MYAGKLAEKAKADVVHQNPLHPYTQLLISSLPEVGMRHDEHTLVGIPGRLPRSSIPRPAAGSDRCPFAFARCANEPTFVEVKPGHSVACWPFTRTASARREAF